MPALVAPVMVQWVTMPLQRSSTMAWAGLVSTEMSRIAIFFTSRNSTSPRHGDESGKPPVIVNCSIVMLVALDAESTGARPRC